MSTHLSDLIGTSTALEKRKPSSVAQFVRGVAASAKCELPDDTLTIAGGALGVLTMPEHRVLGAVGGASLGRNVPALLDPEYRRDALCNMAHTGSGVLGSLIAKAHPGVGFVLGYLLGGAIIHFGGFRK